MISLRRLISTINLSRNEWLKVRRTGITGTDAAAICGLNPFKSAFAVYQDKISEAVDDNFDNEAMRQGRDMEEYVARRFEEATGKKCRKANAVYQNEEHPILLADFDRLIVGEKAGLECKTVNAYSADQWANGAIPYHYQLQVQHYLAVSGYDCWYIAALIYGRDFVVQKIDRDEELISYLIRIEEKFWNDNVLARAMPEPDGTDNCSEIISKMYLKSDKDKSIELLGYNDILNRRMELEELISKLEQEKTAIDQKIKLELQDASYGFTADYKVSWSNAISKRLDTKLLKEEGQAYLIPYKNKGQMECQFQIGYKGLIDLAYRNGQMQTIQAQAVYENDYFKYEYGLEPKLIHRPASSERGELVYFYGIFKTVNGGFGFSVMSKADMDQYAKTYSKAMASEFSPWRTSYEEMAKKTVIKQALKYAPIKTEFQRALSTDETIKNEISEEMFSVKNEVIEIV